MIFFGVLISIDKGDNVDDLTTHHSMDIISRQSIFQGP